MPSDFAYALNALNTVPPLTRPVSPAAIVPVSNTVPHAVMFSALRLVASTFANVLSAVVFVYASVIPYSARVVPAFALPATVSCNAMTSFTKPLVVLPRTSCKPKILPAFTSIAALLSATFFTKPVSASFTVASNALIESVCPLTVDFNVLISLVLVATLVFKLPTVMEESAAPSLTSSVILAELIEVTLTAYVIASPSVPVVTEVLVPSTTFTDSFASPRTTALPVSEMLSKAVLAFNANAPCTSPPVTKPVFSVSIVPVRALLSTFNAFPFASVSIVRPSPAFTFNAPSSAIFKPPPAFTFNAFLLADVSDVSTIKPPPAFTFKAPLSANVRPSPAFTSKMSLFFAMPFPKPNAVPPVVVNASNASCNCSTVTASVPASPFSTLVIFLPPASIPSDVTLGPPEMARPVLVTVVLPTVKPVALKEAAVPIARPSVFSVALPTVTLPESPTVSSLTVVAFALNVPSAPTVNLPPAALMAPLESTVNLSPEILNAPLLETESLPSIVVVKPSVALPVRSTP